MKGRAKGLFANEQNFALLMVTPGIMVLVLTTTFPLAYLVWSSFQTINLAMPFLDGFAGLLVSVLSYMHVFVKYSKALIKKRVMPGSGAADENT